MISFLQFKMISSLVLILYFGLLSGEGIKTTNFPLSAIFKYNRNDHFSNNLMNFRNDNKMESLLNSLLSDSFTFIKELTISTPNLQLNLELQGTFDNTTTFTYNNISENDLHIVLKGLLVEKLNFNGSYKMDGMAFSLFPLVGKGNVGLHLGQIMTNISLHIIPVSGVIFLEEFSFSYDINDMQVELEGLFNEPHLSTLLNSFIQDLVPKALKNLRNRLSKSLESIVLDTCRKIQLEDLYSFVKSIL